MTHEQNQSSPLPKFHSDVDSMSVGVSGTQDAAGGYNAALTATFKFRDPRQTADPKDTKAK